MAAAELADKIAIVTGASRGLGFAIAKKFVLSGARVVMTGRNLQAGEAAAAGLSKTGNATFVAADHGSSADWDRVIETALSRFGRIDILVANAGITHATPTADMTLEEFRGLNRTNLKGCFLGVKHAVAAMRRHGEGGAIVLMSSIVGKVGIPGLIHYSAAKGGLRLMAKAAALELGPEKIRVNSLHPGMIRTDMTAPFPEAQMAVRIPLGKFGEPEDVANAALFLAGPRGQFITGTELVIDGGWLVQ
ncbi:MAG: SDR family NAD(P)-dependent oxidoreductase [Rhizomicrobium sp.]